VIDPHADPVNESPATNGPDHGSFEPLLSDDVRGLLLAQESRAREFIRAHPLGVVLSALALGYIAARLMRED
jgi:hypothetical protein